MLATLQFVQELATTADARRVSRLQVDLFGSLALTGIGHRTDRAVVAGLSGQHPRTVDPLAVDTFFAGVENNHQLEWLGKHTLRFELKRDLLFHRETFLPQHPNGLRCTAYDDQSQVLLSKEYFSVGGGFVVCSADFSTAEVTETAEKDCPFPFRSAAELLSICESNHLSIAQVVQANELMARSEADIESGLDEIWAAMQNCIKAGCQHPGVLPGGLEIRRRAPQIFTKLSQAQAMHEMEGSIGADPLQRMDWVNLFALAVNEENAAGGRVVTAPTNGAAGVIPAVCTYYRKFLPGSSQAGVHVFLKTAAAVGMLYKRNASLSAAEMGCQGEVGVACSMAAAGLAAVMGGTPEQIENAAEIGMEHNLGLTCDPIAGLVQVPCIERNTMGAVKAVNAARLAVLYGDGKHRVSLDKVIETMRQTGLDMQSKYKETSLGGLAVNVTVC